MNNRPIGVFDSGVGGLTVLKRLHMAMPEENYIYFGDTARVPYGEKTPEQLVFYVKEILEWFKTKKVKAAVMACNTSSAVVYDKIKDDYDFPVFSLIEPTAKYVSYLDDEKIGVLATTATVNSKAYSKLIKKLNPTQHVLEVACPGLVEIVESNRIETQEARKQVIRYVIPLIEEGVEKIILGCTHYPFLSSVIAEIVGSSEMLIDPAWHLTEEVSGLVLDEDDVNCENTGTQQFFVSANPEMFREAGKRFYPDIGEVNQWSYPDLHSIYG